MIICLNRATAWLTMARLRCGTLLLEDGFTQPFAPAAELHRLPLDLELLECTVGHGNLNVMIALVTRW